MGNLVGNFGTVFCDQAYWQSSVAAKPLQGVWGFIAGGLCWFAIPFGLATTMGLAYLSLSSAQGAPLLSDEDVMKGLAAPLVAQKLLGPVGEYSMLFLILDLNGFNIWTTISRGWAFTAAAVIIILPLFQEVAAILKQLKKNAKEGRMMEDRSQNEALMQDMQQKSHSSDSRPIIKSGLGYKIINKHLDLTNTPSLSNSSSSSSITSSADSKSSSTSSLVNA